MTPVDHEHWHRRANEPLRMTIFIVQGGYAAITSPGATQEEAHALLQQAKERVQQREERRS